MKDSFSRHQLGTIGMIMTVRFISAGCVIVCLIEQHLWASCYICRNINEICICLRLLTVIQPRSAKNSNPLFHNERTLRDCQKLISWSHYAYGLLLMQYKHGLSSLQYNLDWKLGQLCKFTNIVARLESLCWRVLVPIILSMLIGEIPIYRTFDITSSLVSLDVLNCPFIDYSTHSEIPHTAIYYGVWSLYRWKIQQTRYGWKWTCNN